MATTTDEGIRLPNADDVETWLPPELWLNVFDLLAPQDLSTVSRLSNKFHILSRCHLHRRIYIDGGKATTMRVLRCMVLLLRTREMLHYVQELHIVGHGRISNWDPFGLRDQIESLPYWGQSLETVNGILTELQIPDLKDWKSAIRIGSPFAWVAALLPLLPNLKLLRLDYMSVHHGGWPGLMLTHLTSGNVASRTFETKFDRLRLIDYGSNVPSGLALSSWGMDHVRDSIKRQFAGLFRPPRVEHLGLWLRYTDGIFDRPKDGCELNFRSLKSMVLAATDAEELIYDILKQTTGLQTLHLGLAYRDPAKPPFQEQDGIEWIRNGLLMHQKGLENLSLVLELDDVIIESSTWRKELDTSLQPFTHGFFRSFRSLKTLEVPIQVLVGRRNINSPDMNRLLPKSLRKLLLRYDVVEDRSLQVADGGDEEEEEEEDEERNDKPWNDDSIFHCTRRFLDSRRWQTPHLEIIAFRVFDVLPFFVDDATGDVVALSERYGILVEREIWWTTGMWTYWDLGHPLSRWLVEV
ncbi:hypothetical protein BO71DRAFT_413264 [Aspergillus ellipticus CBS 707.79]|uniref:F-box domain-containing protein n=1 Tax=Aspergillus ellipticus CBS 707.79 TaxID=1448320 RepID=A0A319CY95_9EURO|nr:hypothetical protein BO71DRAFT_413264 [Aspergillus ellipticus CBS 707.79]